MKNLFALALFAGIAVSQSQAQADISYQQKLAALNAKVDVVISGSMPFLKKVEGVNQLYKLVFESGCNPDAYFNREGLIQTVLVHQPIQRENTPINPARSLLREHTILFDYSGADNANLLQQISTFQAELDAITVLEGNLKKRLPNLVFERVRALYNGVTNTNRSYLEALNNFEKSLNSRYSTPLSTFDRVWVQDTAENYSPTAITKFRFQIIENGKLATKSGIQLRFGRQGFYQENSEVSVEFITQLFEVILVNGFDGLEYFLMEEDQIKAMISDFSRFLTPDRVAVLKAKGVKSFYFKDTWQNEGELLNGSRLTLGTKLEEMETIYKILFGN